jgi:hypothetical protein
MVSGSNRSRLGFQKRREKRERRLAGGFYREGDVQEGVGFWAGEEIDGGGGRSALPGSWPELGDDLTCGSHISASNGRGRGTLSG